MTVALKNRSLTHMQAQHIFHEGCVNIRVTGAHMFAMDSSVCISLVKIFSQCVFFSSSFSVFVFSILITTHH